MPEEILDLKGLRELAKQSQLTVAEAISEGASLTVLAETRRRQVLDVLEVAPEAVQSRIKALSAKDIVRLKPRDVIEQAIKDAGLPKEEQARIETEISEPAVIERLVDLENVDREKPAAELPEMRSELARANVVALAEIAKLSDEGITELLDRVPSLESLSNQRVGTLAIEGKIDEKGAKRLGMLSGFAQLLAGDIEAVGRVTSTEFKALGRPPEALSDLLFVDSAELSKSVSPELHEKDPEAAMAGAAALRHRIEERFPDVGVRARLPKPQPAKLREQFNVAAEAIRKEPAILTNPDALEGLKEEEKEALSGIRTAIRAYPGMGLTKIAQSDDDPQEIAQKIDQRIDVFDKVIAQNPETDFMQIDLTSGSEDLDKLDFSGVSDEDRAGVINVIQSRARAYRVGGTVRNAAALMQGGYHSAMAIAASDPMTVSVNTGLSATEAGVVYARARDTRLTVTNLVATLADELVWQPGGYNWIPWFPEDVTDGLKKLPGYEDLFGNQSFCDCAHCDSILSPAAYFVDLMNFVDDNVTSKEFTGAKANHALKLENRRPDLWTTPLTCDNTHDLVPTLSIINGILETALAKRADAGLNLNDRNAVLDKVYGDELPAANRSFVTPFVLGAAEADQYVKDFDTDRAEILGLIRPDAPANVANAAALKLSMPSYEMITTPRAQWGFLVSLYRMPFPRSGNTANAFDVQDIMAGMEISRDDFGALVETQFVESTGNIRIRAQKRSPESVQNDIERVTGMTRFMLDRAHRFWRLAQAIGWDPATLDVVLSRAGGNLSNAVIRRVIRVAHIGELLGLEPDQVLALGGGIPLVTMGRHDTSLMDRLFNETLGTEGATPFPADALNFVHPGLRDDASLPDTGPNAGVFVSQRLRMAFGISDGDLLELILALAPTLGFDPEAALEADRGFLLTEEALSLLYRHALLAEALDLSVSELFMAIRVATGAGAVSTFDHVIALIEFVKRAATMPFDLPVIAALMGISSDPVADGTFFDPDALADQVIAAIANGERTLFAPTVFAYLDGVSEDQSRAIIAANPALFDAAARDMLRLKPGIGLAPAIVAPDGGFPSGIALADLQAVLDGFNLRRILPEELALALDLPEDKFAALAALSGADFMQAGVIAAANGGPAGPLSTALARMRRPVAALADDDITMARVAFIDANRALFALANPVAAWSRASVGAVAGYIEALEDSDEEDHAVAVEAVLLAHANPGGFAAADTAQFAAATGADLATVRVFEAAANLPALAVPALTHLRRIVEFAKDRRLSADAMALLASEDGDALAEGAESLKAALRLRLGDEEAFASASEAHEDALRGKRRDALTDRMIRNSAGRFDSRGDLYNYYLIDPDMEGCARTSLVVSAIGSLQSYVHRVVLNMEQDRRDPDAANHVHISPSRIPADEWEWRKNYRVWEANRKVFLWPENYMLPELRDNKTPQFETLEKTLLQQDVTEQTVLDAYAAYLRGFEEVAGLRIAGAYHEHVWSDAQDVMHVFGCTADDPPSYYYWTINNLTFSKFRDDRRLSYSARRKIDVAIPVRDVSPFMYNNRLHLFWMESSTSSRNVVEDGENRFIGYRHTFKVMYTFLRLDGSWAAPQQIDLGRNWYMREGGVLNGGLVPKLTGSSILIPSFSDQLVAHNDYEEGYRLNAPAWQKVYPAVLNGQLYLSLGAWHFQYQVDLYERKATARSTSQREMMDNYWRSSRMTFHMSGSSSNRRIYDQTMYLRSNLLSAPLSARRDFVRSRSELIRNILSLGYSSGFGSTIRDDMNFFSSDLGGSIARVNDPNPHLVVPDSDFGLPCMIVQKETDASLLTESFNPDGRPFEARRVGTTVLTDLSRTLFYGGVDALLDKQAQADFKEKAHLVTSSNMRTRVRGTTSRLDYTGPLGVYFREVFLHIPALLASHQNSRGDYAAAQGWYQTIFDPTAKFDSGVDLGSLSASARRQAERDRVWQYAEFQGMSPPSLRSILTDEDAQEAYRKDPFNPHAIARLRLSAFQKNIVMRYVNNLLDWADSLFRQFQRETVDEAHILYDLARQIMGPRPADAGDCGEGRVRPRTYARIKPHMEAGQDFLIEAENYWIQHGVLSVATNFGVIAKREFVGMEVSDIYALDLKANTESMVLSEMTFDSARMVGAPERVDVSSRGRTELEMKDDLTVAMLDDVPSSEPAAPVLAEHVAAEKRYETAYLKDGTPGRQLTWNGTGAAYAERGHMRVTGATDRNWRHWRRMRPDAFTTSVIRQVGPVFCVPRNKDLMKIWDRIEDRLYKIHNCRNIDGERVDMALFAPEIDPMALVRARAAGLSLSDILGASAGNLPPYRFSYLISKAREYTSLVQGYGSKLQGAIERRDGEELAKLRLQQAINMQNLVTKVRENEVKIAKENLEEVNRRKAAVEYRKSYYEGNITNDLLSWERAEQISTHAAGISKGLSAMLSGTAGIFYLIPQLGSPFAMKYGGAELGASCKEWAKVFKDTGTMLDIFGKSASLEAKYQRRRKGWEHSKKLDEHELKQIEKKIAAAEIRVEIAEKSLENHLQAIEDQEEILDFYESKFSGEALYTWMASTLQTIYRQAFNAAFSMAQLAEQAYRFERPDDTANLLELSYWEPGQAGLLSGEKLAADLVAMEKRFLETNYRVLEITQPFSLAEIDPAGLMRLREEGECTFTIPELAFDLLYPGQYRRIMKSVRLSIACVTGPYVNIPATLTLTGSKLRVEPTQDGPAGLTDSLLRHTVQIATSTAQADAGVFDFSFADPRYMPFEGAGAVESTWKVTLPRNFRPFDYATINDVILQISYSAESDGVLRDRVEDSNAALEGALAKALSDNSIARAYSFRQEFATVLHQLATGPLNVDAVMTLDQRALPVALRNRAISIDQALLLIKPADGLSATGTQISINGTPISGFAPIPDFPGYVGANAAGGFGAGLLGDHAVRVVDAGDLAPGDATATAAFEDGAVQDIVLFVQMSLN
ncbi:neuraminidase-like domain-containing protein [Roseovarius sp. 2305UL8-3]|uniref:Tc toxin subunit A-related protein n=1 Tax=Roseovarius conchicola TaxID=3121636 RepID=UPI00352831F2